ncbi:MAG TPA: hypothetical protein QF468_08635 [Nitrospinota bacterium]|jgi:hypothetical protein|nr:hypothetical protein [Nitrospinota bacterium]|tara:strand:+ start:1995 stop:2624 length:630 start_codon:yes stop_codon:yes gene_type:complete
MKKLIITGTTLFLIFFSSRFATASVLNYATFREIVNFQPVLDQYYENFSNSNYQVKVERDGHIKKVEFQNKNREWNLVQIHNENTGLISFFNNNFLRYTRELEDGLLAHYNSRAIAEADKAGQNANYYTKFSKEDLYTYYYKDILSAWEKSGFVRVSVKEDECQIETNNPKGEWEISRAINMQTGIISNFEGNKMVSTARLTPNGTTVF